jgi:undecaprenyl diphosphate synthase
MEKTQEKIPNHVVIIPDGNRRWAKEHNLKPWEGHEEGARNFEKLLSHSLKLGVKCLSIWGSSTDNLSKRPMRETKALLDIYGRYIKRMLEGKEIHENEVRVNFIGRWEEQFPEKLKKLIYEVREKTKNYKKRMLNLLLAYSGTDEMLEAIQRIHDKYQGHIQVTPKIVKENLFTRDLPSVDLLIRTGGEPHNSNGLMMWDVADAQYFFTIDKFPDFDERKYEEAISNYSMRQRRFGK